MGQTVRAKAQLEKLQSEIAATAKKTGISAATKLALITPSVDTGEDIIPEVEWWDIPILANGRCVLCNMVCIRCNYCATFNIIVQFVLLLVRCSRDCCHSLLSLLAVTPCCHSLLSLLAVTPWCHSLDLHSAMYVLVVCKLAERLVSLLLLMPNHSSETVTKFGDMHIHSDPASYIRTLCMYVSSQRIYFHAMYIRTYVNGATYVHVT